MAKNFLEICQYISLMPNSELSTINGIADVTTEERNAINRALMQVWNEVDNWDFRYKKTTFSTEAGVATIKSVSASKGAAQSFVNISRYSAVVFCNILLYLLYYFTYLTNF